VTTSAAWIARRSEPDPSAPPCALCGATGDALRRLTSLGTSPDLAALGEFRVVFCTRCENARTVPLPGLDALAIAPDVAAPELGALQRALLRRFIAQRVERVRPWLPERGRSRLLDVGSGACLFANAIASEDCAVTAFEPNAANASSAAPGVRFVGKPFDDASVRQAGLRDGEFQVVTMWHSLEHVPDPAATLRLARRLLCADGALYVCVPNLASLQAAMAGNRWCYLDIPHHVTHFTVAGLQDAMRRAGFEVGRVNSWNEEYEIFGFYQSLLNVVTRSHNYFYNRAKKGRVGDSGPSPAWTRVATAAGPLLLPLAAFASLGAAAIDRPACAEVVARVPV
jgi:SAM-dependent methyltransferase